MKVDVLLAAYNGDAFLEPLLQSLESQSDPAFRVLVQDDGSTDGTLSLLSDWFRRDHRFQPGLAQGLHLGAMRNFFSLISQSDADAVLLCDQDDVWESRKIAVLRRSLSEAQTRYGADVPLLIHSDCSVIDESGAVLAESFFRHQGWDPAATTLSRLLVQNNVTGCTLIMNRALCRLITAHANPERLFMHDWFIALSAAAFGHVIFVNQPLTRYRQHGDNAIGASTRNQLERGLEAMSRQARAKERLQLNYTHTRAFLDAYGASLPPEAHAVVQAFLSTEHMPKLRRVLAVQRMGCIMQSPLTRLGQILFG